MVDVIWSKKANHRRIALLTYGKKEFSLQVACKLNARIESYADRLSANPQMGAMEPLLKDRKLMYRSLVIHKFFKLIYYINEKKQCIVIADFWDTRREPSSQANHIQSK